MSSLTSKRKIFPPSTRPSELKQAPQICESLR